MTYASKESASDAAARAIGARACCCGCCGCCGRGANGAGQKEEGEGRDETTRGRIAATIRTAAGRAKRLAPAATGDALITIAMVARRRRRKKKGGFHGRGEWGCL